MGLRTSHPHLGLAKVHLFPVLGLDRLCPGLTRQGPVDKRAAVARLPSPTPSLAGTDTPRTDLRQIPDCSEQECSRRTRVGRGCDCWQALRTPRGSKLESTAAGAAEIPLKREGGEMPRRELTPVPGTQKSQEVGGGNRVNSHNGESYHGPNTYHKDCSGAFHKGPPDPHQTVFHFTTLQTEAQRG